MLIGHSVSFGVQKPKDAFRKWLFVRLRPVRPLAYDPTSNLRSQLHCLSWDLNICKKLVVSMNHLIAPQVIQFWEEKVLFLRSLRSRGSYKQAQHPQSVNCGAFKAPDAFSVAKAFACRRRHTDQVCQERYLGLAGGSGWTHVLQVLSKCLLYRQVCMSCQYPMPRMLLCCASLAVSDSGVMLQYLPGFVATLALIMTNCIRRYALVI